MKNMTREMIERLVDELTDAAKYVQTCEHKLNHTDGYQRQHLRELELADRSFQELRERFITICSTEE
jgi:hypothetical protein